MPSFLSRPKRMSNHRARPRSGEFSAQKLKPLEPEDAGADDDADADSQERRSGSARSPARSYSAPYSRRSPAALIIDSGDSGGSRGIRVRPADDREAHGHPYQHQHQHQHQHEHQQQQEHHRRVVSLSWPGEARLVERDADWDQQLQEMSRRISSSSSGSGSGSSGSKAADGPAITTPAPAPAPTTALEAKPGAKAAPNKRQRQMAFSKKRVSSGPIDIPPSPRTGNAPARGFHGALLLAGGDDADSSRGGRAATDAGEWYPCWSATRPDDKKCGEGGGPPEHILIWERAVRSGSQQHQAIGAGGGGAGGGGSTRVSEGSARGEVVEEDCSEAEDAEAEAEEEEEDEMLQMRPERNMSSDQDQGSATVMLFEMDMDI